MAVPQLDANARAARVRLMIFDVDGVLTDGGLMFTGSGDTMKVFNSLDGHGAKLLREAGLVSVRPDGQRRLYRLEPGQLAALDDWLKPFRAFWADRLDALEAHLEREQ